MCRPSFPWKSVWLILELITLETVKPGIDQYDYPHYSWIGFLIMNERYYIKDSAYSLLSNILISFLSWNLSLNVELYL